MHIFIMLVTTVYIWLLGIGIEKSKEKGKTKIAKAELAVALILSLGTLGLFKYSGFILENIGLYGSFKELALPIGISFYTFQSLSYIIDVYRGNVKSQKSYINFAMYISLFPQLIAGPIVRYTDIENQLEGRKYSFEKLSQGIIRFAAGLGKKVILANQIGAVWEVFAQGKDLSMLGAWLGAIAFALQIYFDFSAYSDMAIGLGKMFGFDFPENFRYPYMSASVSEFWRRWHITLGVWFREYVYIPLGGNRKGQGRMVLNLFIVWFLTGFWHGADWRFIFWGIYYFVFILLEKLFLFKFMEKWPDFLKRLYTSLVCLFGWVIFASETMEITGSFYKAMFKTGVNFVNDKALFSLSSSWILIAVGIIGSTDLPKKAVEKLKSVLPEKAFKAMTYLFVFVIVVISLAFLTADTYNPFLYFRF